jgi:hypothetical protein
MRNAYKILVRNPDHLGELDVYKAKTGCKAVFLKLLTIADNFIRRLAHMRTTFVKFPHTKMRASE